MRKRGEEGKEVSGEAKENSKETGEAADDCEGNGRGGGGT